MPRWLQRTTLERFEEKYIPEPNSGCWLWTAGTACGYGAFKDDIWGEQRAHRVSYRFYKGDIPPGKEIDHLCKVKLCVNPEHLEAVPHKINMFRADQGVVAKNWHKTHCVNGHELSGDNISIRKHGITEKSRVCLLCERASSKKKYEKKMSGPA